MEVSKVIRRILVPMLCSSGIGLQAAEVVDLRMWRAPDHTRLVLDLSDAVEYSSFLLEDPHRLVVDIKSSLQISALTVWTFLTAPSRDPQWSRKW